MGVWHFLRNFQEIQSDFAILILNQPILCEPLLIKSLWNKAVLRVLVDGGSNRWLDFLRQNEMGDVKLPDFLSGDFDSLKVETRAHFEGLKVNFFYTPDQDETDFTKALRRVKDQSQSKNLDIKLVFAVCENAGRFDQIIGNINTLHSSNRIFPDTPVIILSSEGVTWVLNSGKHTIYVAEEYVESLYSCGLIPFCGPTLTTTTGLKWNLGHLFFQPIPQSLLMKRLYETKCSDERLAEKLLSKNVKAERLYFSNLVLQSEEEEKGNKKFGFIQLMGLQVLTTFIAKCFGRKEKPNNGSWWFDKHIKYLFGARNHHFMQSGSSLDYPVL